MNKLARFKAMSVNERRFLLQACGLFWVVPVILRIAGFEKCRRFIARWSAGGVLLDGNSMTQPWLISTADRSVKISAKYTLFPASCLTRSLVLWGMLQRAGIAAKLHIGVRKNSIFEAHAWVECDGIVVNDDLAVVQNYSSLDLEKRRVQ